MVKIFENHRWLDTIALCDSGSETSFINSDLITTYNLSTTPLATPLLVGAATGEQTLVTHGLEAVVDIGGHVETILFGVIPIPSISVILGASWFDLHRVSFNFGKRYIDFSSSYCRKHCGIRNACQNCRHNFSVRS